MIDLKNAVFAFKETESPFLLEKYRLGSASKDTYAHLPNLPLPSHQSFHQARLAGISFLNPLATVKLYTKRLSLQPYLWIMHARNQAGHTI